MENKQLHLKSNLTEKELKLLADNEDYDFNPFIFQDGYISLEFGLMAISSFMEIPIYEDIKINIINPDNWSDEIKYQIEKLGKKVIRGKDMALIYISTDSLPGYKIVPNKEEFSKYEGDLIYTLEYGILFIHVIED
jgi:hypothetical protein